MTPHELLRAEVRLAHRAMLAHATAVADARFGEAGDVLAVMYRALNGEGRRA